MKSWFIRLVKRTTAFGANFKTLNKSSFNDCLFLTALTILSLYKPSFSEMLYDKPVRLS